MFSVPHINKFQFLLGALVIEPASREQEYLVGTVLLQLKRNLKRNLIFVTYFVLHCVKLALIWERKASFTLLEISEAAGTEKVGQSPEFMKEIVKNNNRRVLHILTHQG